jgi:hypothetical protein
LPTTSDDITLLQEQKCFVFAILKQKVLTSNGIAFIVCVQSNTGNGNATTIYSDLVECYSKSTAAQLSASEIKQDLSTFNLDDTWKYTNLTFTNACATRILDLDLVLIQATTVSQKRILITRSITPQNILSMSISEFEASKKLTGLSFGPALIRKLPFPPSLTTSRMMKFVLIKLNIFFKLLPEAPIKLKESKPEAPIKLKESKPTLALVPARPSGNTTDSKVFIGRDGGNKHSYLIAPENF